MGRPRKALTPFDTEAIAHYLDTHPEPALPARHLLPALLAKAKADGDQALIQRILAACSEVAVDALVALREKELYK
jgi:hypothetical protein